MTHDLAQRVIAHATRHNMFSAGQRVGVAVSGGADSMCLLHLLHELGPQWNLHLSVLHVDHGIRGAASRADAEFVRDAAAQFGLPFYLHTSDVPAIDDNLEQAARRVRHLFYSQLISSRQLDRVATGHTGSDQAETVLYRLLRGSGLAGLSGIRPVTEIGFVRPLLPVWRKEIEAWLRERAIAWREDVSNQDLTFARNRLRHDTLPGLREAFNPNLDQTLAHMAILAQDEESYWNEAVDKSGVGQGPTGGPVILLATDLKMGHPALARRQIRRAIERVKGDLRQIEFVHVETILEMARAEPGHGRAQLPGIDVMRSFDWVRIVNLGFGSGLARDFECAVNVPGSIQLPEGGIVTFELIEPEGTRESYARVKDELDWQRLVTLSALEAHGKSAARVCLLEVRNWRPGDQYRTAGQSHEQKIKTLFQEGRVPLWERRHWPVVTCGRQIVWTRRFGAAADLVPQPGTSAVLRIHETSSPA